MRHPSRGVALGFVFRVLGVFSALLMVFFLLLVVLGFVFLLVLGSGLFVCYGGCLWSVGVGVWSCFAVCGGLFFF